MVTTLAFVPTGPATLYAGTLGNQVLKSTDRGRTWHSASTGLGNASVSTLAVAPRRPHTIFAGTQWNGLFKSADGGLSWRRVPIGFPAKAQARVPAVAVDPQHPDTAYVAACRGGGCVGPGVFLKTRDGGATWRRITTVPWLVQAHRDRPAQDEHGIRGDARGGLFRSRNGGSTWHNVASAPGVPQARSHLSYPYAVVALAIDPRDADNIYAGSRTAGILKSADGGTTWAVANTGLTNLRVSALIIDPRKPTSALHEHRGRRVQEHERRRELAGVQSRPAGRRRRGVCDRPCRPDRVRRDKWRRRRRAPRPPLTG